MMILGDCREWLESVPSCLTVDALVTDPPYGVGFKGKKTKDTINRPATVYEDSPESFRSVVLPAIDSALKRAARGAIFCGTRNLQEYPKAVDIGGIVCPAGGGFSPWGFCCYNPVLFYGKNPYVSTGKGSYPTWTTIYHPGMHITGENDNQHPCPKPIAFMEWLVDFATLPGETILDPFAGSGTTGVAALRLGRKFIGVEIEPKYFDIACQRIESALNQGRLFA